MTLSPGGSTCGACFTGLPSTTTNGCTATTSSSGSLTATVTSGPAPGCYSARPPHELPHPRPDQADHGAWLQANPLPRGGLAVQAGFPPASWSPPNHARAHLCVDYALRADGPRR